MKKIEPFNIEISKVRLSKIILFLSVVACVTSLIAQITLTNKYTIKGSEMTHLISRREELETELSLLKIKVSETGSLKKLEIKARQLGFIEYSDPIAIIDSSQFAAIR